MTRSPALLRAPARLDWRFLLSDPDPGHAGFIGRGNGGALEALRRVCRSVDLIEGHHEGPDAPTYELVLAREPSDREIRLAADRVRPDGALVVEARWPAAALGIRRRLIRLGFAEVRTLWHWPDFDRCTRIIPLESETSMKLAFSRGGRGPRDRITAAVAWAFYRLGLLGWGVTSVSVVARRSSGAPSFVRAVLQENHPTTTEPDRSARAPSFLILTPRFRTSSHLVLLFAPEGEPDPTLVAKIPRSRSSAAATSSTTLEAARLREIERLRPGGFPSIPRLVAFESVGGRQVLLQTGASGDPMDRATVRRNPGRCCDAVLSWLIEVQTATRSSSASDGDSLSARIDRDLRDVGEALPNDESGMIPRARELVEPLRRGPIPRVLEHGDLSHPNILIDRQGRVSVIDWELAEIRGIPAVDLFFFLAYVARGRWNSRSPREESEAVREAFFGKARWARPYLDRYAEALGVSKELIPSVWVFAWLSQTAGRIRRAAEAGGQSRISAKEADAVRGDWRFLVWREAVERGVGFEW